MCQRLERKLDSRRLSVVSFQQMPILMSVTAKRDVCDSFMFLPLFFYLE
jgi:hypothetical protein